MSAHPLFFAAAQGGVLSSLWDSVLSLMAQFDIEVPLLLAQMLCFSIVAVLLWRYAFKPVLANMEERQRQIESGLKYAADTKAVEAVGRNPGASGKILVQSIIGMALAEAISFYAIFLGNY